MADKQSIEDIRKKVKQRVAQEAGSTSTPDPAKNKEQISRRFVRDCLFANALGDGMLFCELHKDRFVMNKTTGEWLLFNGQHWERDILDQAVAAVEDVAGRYLEEAQILVDEIGKALKGRNDEKAEQLEDLQKKLYKRVKRLRGDTGRKACISFAHTNNSNALAIDGDQFDSNPMLLPCANGVIDLRTGEIRDGQPTDWLFKASPVMWRGFDEPAELWKKTVLEIFDGSEEMATYLRRLLGYAITGITVEHILPIMWGAKGRNGKGTIVETIKSVLGPLAAPAPSELFLTQYRPTSSSGPSPDIMALRGLRLVFGSETDEGRKFSSSKIKWLTGADTLVGRNPYDKDPTYFRPTHTLFLMTNNRPTAPPDDNAFWERVNLIPFKLSFVSRKPAHDYERSADKNLVEKLKEEHPGVLAWLVRGCLEWQKYGLAPPATVLAANQNYRAESDDVQAFIDTECKIEPEAKEGGTLLYERFCDWYRENRDRNEKKTPSHRWFGLRMKKKIHSDKAEQDDPDGRWNRKNIIYFGVRLRPEPLDP